MHALVTGGAGFIGSHLCDELLLHGYEVTALDSLVGQVHRKGVRPAYLSTDVDLRRADMSDPYAVRTALHNVDLVVHLAARVGVGQSMYEFLDYMHANCVGTSVLLEALMHHDVKKLVVASSMSVYGEGLYEDRSGNRIEQGVKRARGQFEPFDEFGCELRPLPTPEWKRAEPGSFYALSKYVQELHCLQFGEAYKLPVTALRFFNVYGTRQSLSNPYTGVIAIFASRLLNKRPPLIYEDGQQRRDFIHVSDVTRAIRLALEGGADGMALNVGSGKWTTVAEIAELLAETLGLEIEPKFAGSSRAGDIRHCYADTSAATAALGFRPSVELGQGLALLAQWLARESADDRVAAADAELAAKGLLIRAQAAHPAPR